MKPLAYLVLALCTCASLLHAEADAPLRLSQFIYEVPVMPGMEIDDHASSENRLRYGSKGSFERTTQTVIVRSKTGVHHSAHDIAAFYCREFESRGFNNWNRKSPDLKGRLQGPNIVTKGDAHIRSMGHIQYAIPQAGDFISLYIEQRRDFNTRASKPLLESIDLSMRELAEDYDLEFKLRDTGEVSDWPTYTNNECFVERQFLDFRYQEASDFCMGNPGKHTFYVLIFPTNAHAEQWANIAKQRNRGNRYLTGAQLPISPIVVGNLVIEHRPAMSPDALPAEFSEELIERLEAIHEEAMSK